MPIRSFGSKVTDDVFHRRRTGRVRQVPPDIYNRLERKLDAIEAAVKVEDLRAMPGNALEALRGDLKGFHSIAVNDQWRVIFRWSDGGAEQVEWTDDH